MAASSTPRLPLLANLWRACDRALLLVILGANLLEPRVVQCLVERDPLFRFLDQQTRDQVLALLRVVRPLGGVKHDSIFASHANRLFLRIVVEWQRAAE